MKKIITFMASLFLAMSMMAQSTGDGAISQEQIDNMRAKYSKNSANELARRAVLNNDIRKLALDPTVAESIDKHFSHRVESANITDQQKSGRCWLFTGLNVLRPKVVQKYGLSSFEFSQNYNFFWDQLEKSNLFLEGMIENREKEITDRKVQWLFSRALGDGGQWTGVVNIIEKYGVVPKEIMPETHSSENTRIMSSQIKRKLREYGLTIREMSKAGASVKQLRAKKEDMLAEVYQMLAISLGEPPLEFEWRYKDKEGNLTPMKKYTPQSFYTEFVDVDLKEYVMFMNDPSREYKKLYEIEYDRHSWDGQNWKYINIDNETIKEYAIKSIMGDDAMYFSCDVGKQLNSEAGVLAMDNYDYGAVFGLEFGMDKKQRILSTQSGSSHGMTLVAVDLDENQKPVKWLLENSWGPSSGFEGHLIMTDKWFDEYMFRVVVHKKYVDQEVLKILEQKPVMLPPWDPMF